MHQIPIKQCRERWKVKPVEGCILAATNKTPAPQTRRLHVDNRPYDAMCCTFDLLTTLVFLLIASFPGTDQLLVTCSMEKQEPFFHTARDKELGNEVRYKIYVGVLMKKMTLGVCEI